MKLRDLKPNEKLLIFFYIPLILTNLYSFYVNIKFIQNPFTSIEEYLSGAIFSNINLISQIMIIIGGIVILLNVIIIIQYLRKKISKLDVIFPFYYFVLFIVYTIGVPILFHIICHRATFTLLTYDILPYETCLLAKYNLLTYVDLFLDVVNTIIPIVILNWMYDKK